MTSKGIDLLISFEGLRLNAYRDASGKPTIGVGSTFYENGDPVNMGDTITTEEAMRLFKSTVDNIFEKGVRDNIRVELQPNQIDALTSLCYNIGVEALKNSTVLRLINSGAPRADIERAWRMWRISDGNVLPGLVTRREKELEYYFSHEPPKPVQQVEPEKVTEQLVPAANGSSTCVHNKLWFTTSTRFLAGLVGVLTVLLGSDGKASGPEIYQALIALSGLFVGLGTLHKKEAIEVSRFK
jgi:Phage-related lysozyme (muraminidase)